MELNEYAEKAVATAVYPREIGLIYTALGLAGESGEVANKVKKLLRDNNGVMTLAAKQELAHEVGDCLWYVAAFVEELGLSLDEVARLNLIKLATRAAKGTLHGSGDER